MEKANVKRYYSKVPGSSFIFQDGHQAIFAHGFLDVGPTTHSGQFLNLSNKEHPNNGRPRWECYQQELDRLVAEGNPLIFTQDTVQNLQKMPPPPIQARSETEIAAQDNLMKRTGAVRETGDANVGTGVAGADINASTVDPQLQAQILTARPVGPGGEAVQRAREAAAARAANAAQGKTQ